MMLTLLLLLTSLSGQQPAGIQWDLVYPPGAYTVSLVTTQCPGYPDIPALTCNQITSGQHRCILLSSQDLSGLMATVSLTPIGGGPVTLSGFVAASRAGDDATAGSTLVVQQQASLKVSGKFKCGGKVGI